MTNLSGIQGLYPLLSGTAKQELSRLVFEYPHKSDIIFHKTIEQIRSQLNINLPYCNILPADCLGRIKPDEFNIVKIPDDNFCLKPLKRTVEKSVLPVILDLDIMPVFYPTNLQNINPVNLLLRVSHDFFLVFGQKPIKPVPNDVWATLAVKTYAELLTDQRLKQEPTYARELTNLFDIYKITCTAKRAFYGFCADMGSTQSADKFFNYLLINDILTRKNGSKICFLLPPLTPQQQEHLLRTVRDALKKLQTKP